MIQDFSAQNSDVEGRLHSIGVRVGGVLLELFEFDRDVDLLSLMYKITYTLLPRISETKRKVEKLKEKPHTFVINEKDSLLGAYVSAPQENSEFSADSLIAGVIEVAVRATGYSCTVGAYTLPAQSSDTRTAYLVDVKIKERVFNDLF